MTSDNDPYVTFEHAFNEIFFASNYNCCLLTIGMNTVAIQSLFLMFLKFFILTHEIFMGCNVTEPLKCHNIHKKTFPRKKTKFFMKKTVHFFPKKRKLFSVKNTNLFSEKNTNFF